MNSLGKYLNSQEEIINHTTDEDIDEFFLHHFGKKFPFEKHELDFPIEIHAGNDRSKYDEWIVEQFKVEDNSENCLNSLLTYLCHDGWLQPGFYIIRKKNNET